MLGNSVFRFMHEVQTYSVYGTVRSSYAPSIFSDAQKKQIVTRFDLLDNDAMTKLIATIKPDVVVNCAGLIKQHSDADDPLIALPINAMLPHRLANLCGVAGARLIHVSTDCVFQGAKGNYSETDISDATDLYGKSKFIGEVDYPHAITLRTSTIGHHLNSTNGLVDWFLSQKVSCKGYTKAIFSGLPTAVLARIMCDLVIPRPQLHGVYHVAAKPISKFELLSLIAEVYRKQIEIIPDSELVIDRSLNADKFSEATGFVAPDWSELIEIMHAYH